MAKKKKWVQKAIKKPGSFTKYCQQHGFGGVTEACIEMGEKSNNPTIRKRASLARTLKKMPRRKR